MQYPLKALHECYDNLIFNTVVKNYKIFSQNHRSYFEKFLTNTGLICVHFMSFACIGKIDKFGLIICNHHRGEKVTNLIPR